MEQYNVTGMTCAACSARVEKAVSKVPGVASCSVSLLTNSMGVEGNVNPQEIVRAVEEAGYGASLKGDVTNKNSTVNAQEDMLRDRETPLLKKRLWTSLIFLLILMYVSMGHMMWGWPLPAILAENHVAMGLLQLLLTIAIMVINQKFFISGFKSLMHRAPNMDTLVALGSAAAFVYSVYALFAMTDAQQKGDAAGVMHYMHEFYFESAAMILTLITVGKMLEAHSKGKTTDALKSLMRLSPKTAVLLVNGVETEVPVEQVKKGDIFVVRPGEHIPVDGIVTEGNGAVDEAALTGESIPVDKEPGSSVSAATVNRSGFLKCEAVRVGEDTTLSQIIQMVSDAAATKAPIAKIADKVSGVFVPAVLGIAAVTILVWLLAGQSVGYALARGISVLVISCPCALGLATPVAIMVGNGVGAKSGIMFKTAVSLEETGKVEIVALDKTGTITNGTPCLTDILPAEGISEEELLAYANAMEVGSEHPLAKAVTDYAKERQVRALAVEHFAALPGNGIEAEYQGESLKAGSYAFMESLCEIPEPMQKQYEKLTAEGKTPLFFRRGSKLLGILAVADVIKEDSPQAVKELRNMGIRVIMLTGDNERTAKAIGVLAGVDEVVAGVLPDGKENVIRSLKEQGKVAMVGDGINDAPALTRADIGIAIGAGTDIAIDAADVVLMKSRLRDVPAAIRLSRATLRNIHQNLFWAFFYNIIGIPLAAGVWIPLFHWGLNPMFGAAAMSLSSFCVVTNALRLNLCQIYNPARDKSVKRTSKSTSRQQGSVDFTPEQSNKQETEETGVKDSFFAQKPVSAHCRTQGLGNTESSAEMRSTMKKTMKIEGMMCGHCEARVKKCLEELPEVTEAVVSHEAGTAEVTLSGEIDNEVLKKTVEEQDYKVISVE